MLGFLALSGGSKTILTALVSGFLAHFIRLRNPTYIASTHHFIKTLLPQYLNFIIIVRCVKELDQDAYE